MVSENLYVQVPSYKLVMVRKPNFLQLIYITEEDWYQTFEYSNHNINCVCILNSNTEVEDICKAKFQFASPRHFPTKINFITGNLHGKFPGLVKWAQRQSVTFNQSFYLSWLVNLPFSTFITQNVVHKQTELALPGSFQKCSLASMLKLFLYPRPNSQGLHFNKTLHYLRP